MRSPHERSSTGAARRRSSPAHRDRRREQRVELLQPFIQREQLVAAFDDEILAELVAAEHLQHKAAEIAQALLPDSQQSAPLLPQLTGMRQGSPLRTGRAHACGSPLFLAAKACQQRRPRHASQCNSEV